MAELGVYSENPLQLAEAEYRRCVELYERYEGPGADTVEFMTIVASVMESLYEIMDIERNHQEELQQLAVDIIRDLYQVPEGVAMTAEYIDEPGTAEDFGMSFEPDLGQYTLREEKREYIEEQVKKRILLNGLSHGSSIHMWKTMQYLAAERLNEVNPQLMPLYNKYAANVALSFWVGEPDMVNEGALLQGYNELKFSEPGDNARVELHSAGLSLPLLLHEVNKSVIDYLTAGAIPDDLNEEELRYYYDKADNYALEYWHYLLSPSLWVDLLQLAEVETSGLPEIISQLSNFSPSKLEKFFISLQGDKEDAKYYLDKMKKK